MKMGQKKSLGTAAQRNSGAPLSGSDKPGVFEELDCGKFLARKNTSCGRELEEPPEKCHKKLM